MIATTVGYLSPIQGALLQEAIDVTVIVNALRALRITPSEPILQKHWLRAGCNLKEPQ